MIKDLTREQLIKKIVEICNHSEDEVIKKFNELEEEAARKGLPSMLYDTDTYTIEIKSYWNDNETELLYSLNEEWAMK